MPPASARGGAGKAILSLVGLQLFSKLVNFGLNVLIVRATGAKLFGVSAVPLALLLSSIQFLSREGVRGACQRIDILRTGQPPDAVATRTELARVVNLSWTVLPLAVLVAPMCVAAAVWRGYDGVGNDEYFEVVMIFGLAAVLELIAEPAYNLVVVCDKLPIRALVDGLAITSKAVTIWVAVVHLQLGALAFAWGQGAYAVAQLFGLYGYAASRARTGADDDHTSGGPEDFPLATLSQLLPAPLPLPNSQETSRQPNNVIDAWFGASAAAEAGALCRQSLLKHLLTEADKLLLLVAGSNTNGNADAVYGVVFNLGSLAGRMVFEPVETQSRQQFGRLAATQRAVLDATSVVANIKNNSVNKVEGDDLLLNEEKKLRVAIAEHRARWCELLPALRVRLRLLGLFGLLFVALGPSYTWLLLHLLYGEAWSSTEAPDALAAYCAYVLLMAINGLAEAFRDSVASGEQLSSLAPSGLTGFMLFSFGVCCAFSLHAVPTYGALGIIAANCLNLALRIVFSLHFIARRVPTPAGVPCDLVVSTALRDSCPGAPLLATLAVASAITRVTRSDPVGGATVVETLEIHGPHVVVGVVAVAAIVVVAALTDDVVRDVFRLSRKERAKTQ